MVGFLFTPFSQFQSINLNPLFSSVVSFTLAVRVASPTDLAVSNPDQPVKLNFQSVTLPASGGYRIYYKPTSETNYSSCPATASEGAVGKKCITQIPADYNAGVGMEVEVNNLSNQAYDFMVKAFTDSNNESPLPCASCEVKNFWVGAEPVTPTPPIDPKKKPSARGSSKHPVIPVEESLHPTAEEIIFSDVALDNWALPFVNKLSAKKIITGYPDGTLRLGNLINRAEAAKIALIASGNEKAANPADSFPDVDAESWYAPYIDQAKKLGIVNGYGDGLYYPARVITRAEALKILINAAGLKGIPGKSQFVDVSESAWFAPYVVFAEKQGIVEGYAEYTLLAKGNLKSGNYNAEVRQLQQLLKQAGYYKYSPTAGFGEVTKASVVKLQTQYPETLSSDAKGEVGVATLQKLYELAGITQPPTYRVFRPNNFITRAEIFKLLSILLDLKEKGYSADARVSENFNTPQAVSNNIAAAEIKTKTQNQQTNSVSPKKTSEKATTNTKSSPVISDPNSQSETTNQKEGSSESKISKTEGSNSSKNFFQKLWQSVVQLFTYKK